MLGDRDGSSITKTWPVKGFSDALLRPSAIGLATSSTARTTTQTLHIFGYNNLKATVTNAR